MKAIFLIGLLVGLNTTAISQKENPAYDKAMADSLGGDDYGMKPYVLVILKTGNKKIDRKQAEDSLFRGHLDNMMNLAAMKKLIVSGPFKKNPLFYRGIFILNVKTIEEANKLLSTDPAIVAGLLEVDVFVWHGSAALPEYLKSHEKIEKKHL